MASAIFDTHAFIQRLTGAGMPEQQAEILAEEYARTIGEQRAAKHDVALLRADMDRLKDQLTIRLGVMMAPGSRSSRHWSGYFERYGRRVSTWR